MRHLFWLFIHCGSASKSLVKSQGNIYLISHPICLGLGLCLGVEQGFSFTVVVENARFLLF